MPYKYCKIREFGKMGSTPAGCAIFLYPFFLFVLLLLFLFNTRLFLAERSQDSAFLVNKKPRLSPGF